MRHKTAERWLSDDLGGSLPAGRRRKLEAHFASCARCRSTRKDWERIRSRAAAELPPEMDGFWAANLARLQTALEKPARVQVEGRNPSRPVPGFFPWRTWALGAGGAGVLATAVSLFILLSPARPLGDSYAYSLGDPGALLEAGLAADESVLAEVNDSLQTSLRESLETVPADVAFLTADHTLSLEGLSDEDVRLFVNEIALETGNEEN